MPRPPLTPILVITMTACNPDTTPKDTAACTVELESTFPVDGAADVYHRAPMEFHLNDDDPTAYATLTGPEGEVAGTSTASENQETIYFTPGEPLLPETAYSARLDACFGTVDIVFQTSELGQPRSASPIGQAYLVDLTQARFTEPEAIAGVIGQALRFDVLLGVSDLTDGESIHTSLAIAVEGSDPTEQDYCSATTDFGEGDFTGDPWFHLGPLDATFNLSDHDVVIRDLEISATFSPDATSFGGGQLGGRIDTRENVALFQEMVSTVTDGDTACDALAAFGVVCGDCGDGQIYCMNLVADSITAPSVDGLALETVEQARCHPLCEDNSEDCTL